jgi:Zn-finger nucleic acid-binding protein
METQKDRFGETIKLLEKAKEDIYFAQKDRELIQRLKAQLKEKDAPHHFRCPKCGEELATYIFINIVVERCRCCEGIWLDRGALETILKKVVRGPWSSFVYHWMGRNEEIR